MKAMILAAGLGTRLKPLTDSIPKALVEVGGKPMLRRVIESLKNQGFGELVINVHHFSAQVEDYLKKNDFGMTVKISDESEELLDTGGGIVKARELLFSENTGPVLFHNVDILSDADLKTFMEDLDGRSGVLVSVRDSSRKLLFNKELDLVGWHDLNKDIYRPDDLGKEISDKKGYKNCVIQELAFSGIYSLNQRAVEEMESLLGRGKYSVIEYFLHPGRKEKIKGVVADNLQLIDIGKPATLSQASKLFD